MGYQLHSRQGSPTIHVRAECWRRNELYTNITWWGIVFSKDEGSSSISHPTCSSVMWPDPCLFKTWSVFSIPTMGLVLGTYL